jgi:hypothetical protein
MQVPFACIDMRFRQVLPGLRSAAVSFSEIQVGATKICPSLGEFSIGGTVATMVAVVTTVVAVVMAAIAAATLVLGLDIVVIATEQTQESSDGSSGDSSFGTEDTSDGSSCFCIAFNCSNIGHNVFSIVARGARACSMPAPGACRRGD